ncbi:unnamed protein product [Brassica rapa subsp. trilocularis]
MVKQEIIFVPYPTPGHLLVTIEFAKSLIKRDHRIHTITILHWTLPYTPHADLFAKSLIASEPQIRFHALPEVKNPPPFDLFLKATEAYVLEFTKATVPLVRDALSALVSSRDGSDPVRVAGLVLDFFSVPLIEVGNEFNLPSYIFLTCNAGFLGMLKYLPERHRRMGTMLDLSSTEDHHIPGYASSVPSKVLPAGQFVRESYEAWVEIAEKIPQAKGILVNSFTCLEQKAFDHFACCCTDNFPPVYPVGPVLSLEDRPSPDLDPSDQSRIMRWLEDQPESSVVYLCFGSYGVLEAPQIEEIARALEVSGHRFLWSIRTEDGGPCDLLPDGFTDRTASKGLVCGWAPQVEVLAHKAVGGFVSHCGWNSVLESLWFGVPIATWPLYAEQQLNAFTMVTELGLAVELRLDYVSTKKEIVKAEEISEAIRSLMDGENTVRGRVKETAEAARKALMDGGSSFVGVKRFMDDLVGEDF